MLFRYAAVLLLTAPFLFAQADAIAVVVGRTVDLAPADITFNVGIATSSDVSLDQVLEATKSLGLVAANLGGVGSQQYGPGPDQTRLVYQFTFTTEFSKFRETNDKVAALRRALVVNTPPMDVQTYAIIVTAGDAAREQARQRILPQLITDARQRGEELARAAGVSLGRIVGLSEASPIPAVAYSGPYGPSALRAAFSLSVRFAVE